LFKFIDDYELELETLSKENEDLLEKVIELKMNLKKKIEARGSPLYIPKYIPSHFTYTDSMESHQNRQLKDQINYYQSLLREFASNPRVSETETITVASQPPPQSSSPSPSPAPTPSTSPKLPPPLSKLTISEPPPNNPNLIVYSSSTGEWRDTNGVKINPLYNV
jgi:hypothetical protein